MGAAALLGEESCSVRPPKYQHSQRPKFKTRYQASKIKKQSSRKKTSNIKSQGSKSQRIQQSKIIVKNQKVHRLGWMWGHGYSFQKKKSIPKEEFILKEEFIPKEKL